MPTCLSDSLALSLLNSSWPCFTWSNTVGLDIFATKCSKGILKTLDVCCSLAFFQMGPLLVPKPQCKWSKAFDLTKNAYLKISSMHAHCNSTPKCFSRTPRHALRFNDDLVTFTYCIHRWVSWLTSACKEHNILQSSMVVGLAQLFMIEFPIQKCFTSVATCLRIVPASPSRVFQSLF